MVGRTGDHRISEPSTVLTESKKAEAADMQGDLCEEWRSDLEIISFHHESVKELPKTFTVFKRRGTTWDCCNTIPSFHGILKDRYWKEQLQKWAAFLPTVAIPHHTPFASLERPSKDSHAALSCARQEQAHRSCPGKCWWGWMGVCYQQDMMTTLTLIPSQQSQSHWSIWSKLENLGLIGLMTEAIFNSMSLPRTCSSQRPARQWDVKAFCLLSGWISAKPGIQK